MSQNEIPITEATDGADMPAIRSKSKTVRTGGPSSPPEARQNWDNVYNSTVKYRKLTVVECERLQTLPDNYTEGISNSQRYKCLGNGWTVDVIAHLLKESLNAA